MATSSSAGPWRRRSRAALDWDASRCLGLWERGLPLLAEAAVSLPRAGVEALLGPAMECVAALGAEDGPALQRFAEAWDRGAVGPEVLFPYRRDGRSPRAEVGLGADVLSFLACASLRPTLETVFGACRAHLVDGVWERGLCPFCGAPPGFADIAEDGRRRLACHTCGGAWTFARLGCPFCGNRPHQGSRAARGGGQGRGVLGRRSARRAGRT